MNPRLTLTAAAAVILASISIYPLIQGGSWFWAGVGAVITTAAAGTVSRLSSLQAAGGATVLALIAVSPLLGDQVWALKVLGAVIVVVALASSQRVRLLQALGCLITYLAALLIYLNVAFAARLSVAGIVPTATSVRYLWTLAGQGMAERTGYPPVPGILGVTLLAAGGIGLMAAATDLLAVRLRSPAIAGLPLLALYSVRITTNARQGAVGATLVFCLGMIGYLALLAADGRDRLRIWGRLVTVWHSSLDEPTEAAQAPDTRALAASGRRIGLAAACIALVFPLLIPGVRVHDLFASSGGAGTGTGGTPIKLPNPLVQMSDQLSETSDLPVLTYTTNAPNPRQQYLQVYVLNYQGGEGGAWRLVAPGDSTSVGGKRLPAAPGVAPGIPLARSTTTVQLTAGMSGYSTRLAVLPVPYAPEALQVTGSWQEDDSTLMVYSTAQPLSGLSYTVTSTEPDPGQKVLDRQSAPRQYPASVRSYMGFPAGPGGKLRTLAEQITKGYDTPMLQATALQDWFLSPAQHFTYTLNVKLPSGMAGLIDFLFGTGPTHRRGFCQQFAFAFAALARELGIPSRIAVGYTAGKSEGHGGLWKVTTGDAHAWPEVYIENFGWLRFEPTPAGANGQSSASPPSYTGPTSSIGVLPSTGPTAPPTTAPGFTHGNPAFAHLRKPVPAGSGAASQVARHSIAGVILLVVAGLVGLALITPVTARSLIRRRRLRLLGLAGRLQPGDRIGPRRSRLGPGADLDAELAHAAWRELRDNLADFGLASRVGESPRTLAGRVATTLRLDPDARDALNRIARAEERARYATVPLSPGTLRADTAAVRQALSREADWRARWRAALLPASTLGPIREALGHSLDVFGWMDVAGLRLRDRIRQHG
jgi:transglutaminase-like putative cysteine protease